MCKPARRWRLLAALALLLALAQGRAWGEESLWTRAANLTCRIGNLPRTLIRQPRPAAQPAAPIFAWEKKDAAEWGFAVGGFLEAIRDYKCAYLCYRTLALRYPARQAFAAAAARVRVKYLVAQSYPAGTPGFWLITRIDDQFTWLNPAEPPAPRTITPDALPCCDAEHSDGPLSNDPLYGEERLRFFDAPPCPTTRFDIRFFEGLVPKDRSFSMFPHPAATDATAPTLPEWTDILPDTERSQLLIELCVIDDLRKLLSCTEDWVSY
jgi:hypothetical protein